MPELNGWQTTVAIREKYGEKIHDIPIIGISGEGTQEAKLSCLEVGMHDFMPKPLRKDSLRHMLQPHLGGIEIQKLSESPLQELTIRGIRGLHAKQLTEWRSSA
eukprot:GEZU01015253.1.p2 GENE.GEZU01015253.1~~GEZU01015253.1.p2  ORF type:complete len:104 (-),score=12.70 GEZU01015253.1:250-561(-)